MLRTLDIGAVLSEKALQAPMIAMQIITHPNNRIGAIVGLQFIVR